jgi:hypothetical protein
LGAWAPEFPPAYVYPHLVASNAWEAAGLPLHYPKMAGLGETAAPDAFGGRNA